MKCVKLFGKFLVLLLSVTLISSLLPNKIVSLGLSIDDKGLSKERFYRQLIKCVFLYMEFRNQYL